MVCFDKNSFNETKKETTLDVSGFRRQKPGSGGRIAKKTVDEAKRQSVRDDVHLQRHSE